LDLSFDPGLGADDQVRTIATNSAGQIYIGGDFEHYNGTNRSAIARLFPHGALDLAFDQGVSDNDAVRALAVQPDGKVWVGGLFYQAGGHFRSNLARLNPDGSADDFFDPSAVLNDEVFALDYSADHRLLVGGKFTRVDDHPARRLARLLPMSRTVLFLFDSDAPGSHENGGPAQLGLRRRGSLEGPAAVGMITRNGTAIAGEDFVSAASEIAFAPYQTTGVAPVAIIDDAFAEGDEWFEAELVNPPGVPAGATNQIRQHRIIDNEFEATVDATFQPDSVNGPVYATGVQPDGKVVIGGAFRYRGGCLANSLARLNANGAIDCDFTVHSVGANGPVYAVALQTNGHILVGGQFTYFSSKPAAQPPTSRPWPAATSWPPAARWSFCRVSSSTGSPLPCSTILKRKAARRSASC